jgi:hypothetical protein
MMNSKDVAIIPKKGKKSSSIFFDHCLSQHMLQVENSSSRQANHVVKMPQSLESSFDGKYCNKEGK